MNLYCEDCRKTQPVMITNLKGDVVGEPYQAIYCGECFYMIATGTGIEQAEAQEPIGSVADTDLQGFISDDCSHILVYPKGSYPEGGVDLYTAPPNREWVGLTKEEFFEIYHSPATIIKQMSMIEAKLKEKNE